jgi:hypothetical protein
VRHTRRFQQALGMAAWLLLLSACTHLDVRLVSPDPKRPVYELRGPDLLGLQLEAARLCPQGYEVLRQWARNDRLEGYGFASRWLNKAADALDDEENQAEMSIACKAPG